MFCNTTGAGNRPFCDLLARVKDVINIQSGPAKVKPTLLVTFILNAQVKFNDFWSSDEQY